MSVLPQQEDTALTAQKWYGERFGATAGTRLGLGGRIVEREKLTLVQFPGIYVILRKQDPTGGTVGSSLNHFGFLVKDFATSVASWNAAGLDWEPVVNPQVGQGFLNGPDGVRVEIYEDKSIALPMQMHHIHLLVPDPLGSFSVESGKNRSPHPRGSSSPKQSSVGGAGGFRRSLRRRLPPV